MTPKKLEECVKDKSQYTCRNSMSIYRVNSNAPREVQMYTQQRYYRHCTSKHILSTNEFWIALNQLHSWLYSIAANQ